VILGHTQPELPGCLRVNATGAPAPRDPELRLPSFIYSCARQAGLASRARLAKIKLPTRPAFFASLALRSKDIASSHDEVDIMPQDMVVRSLSDNDLSTAANGNVGQAPSPY
jgi:hypothetical protein